MQQICLSQKTFMLDNQRGFNTKILASYEILEYCKYLFDAEGFYRKSPKSELALEIENNYKCGSNTRQDVLNLHGTCSSNSIKKFQHLWRFF